MRQRAPGEIDAPHQRHRGLLHLHRQHGVVERHLDLLSLSRALPLQQREQDALHHVHARRVVGQRGRVDGERVRRVAFARHDAAERLGEDVLPALVRVGAGTAVAGAFRVDQPRIARVSARPSRGPSGPSPRRGNCWPPRPPLSSRRCTTALPSGDFRSSAMERLLRLSEEKTGFCGPAGSSPIDQRERSPEPIRSTLDDVGAVIAEHLGAAGPHHHLGEIDDRGRP